jgi:hypothetical protein
VTSLDLSDNYELGKDLSKPAAAAGLGSKLLLAGSAEGSGAAGSGPAAAGSGGGGAGGVGGAGGGGVSGGDGGGGAPAGEEGGGGSTNARSSRASGEEAIAERAVVRARAWAARATSVPALSLLIDELPALRSLDLSYCLSVSTLPEATCVRLAGSLHSLCLDGCIGLQKLEGLGKLTALQRLSLHGCRHLKALPESIRFLDASLRYLDISGCLKMVRLPATIGGLFALRYMDLKGCDGLSFLPDLSRLERLLSIRLPDDLAEQPRYSHLPHYKPPFVYRHYGVFVAPLGSSG